MTPRRCDRCSGVVADPAGRRIPEERIRAVHEATCPGAKLKASSTTGGVTSEQK